MKPLRPFTPWPGGVDPPVSGETKVEMLLRCGRETAAYAAKLFIWRDRSADPKTGGLGDVIGWRYPE